MKINELEILEDDFDLFVALDDSDKIEFLFDATEHGTEAAVVKHVSKLADKYMPKQPMVATEDFIVGSTRLCVTTFRDSEIHLNSNSLKADYHKKVIKEKSKQILEKIKEIKKYGKKTHIKVRMVPESNPDSKFIYYAKKPTKGEKAKDKLKLKKYNPNTRKHEFFVEKKLPPHSK